MLPTNVSNVGIISNNLIDAHAQRRLALARNVNSKPLGFDDQLEFGRLLDRKVPAWTLQYFIYLRSSTAAGVNDARSIRHQAPPMSLPSRSQSMHTHCVRCMPIARAAPRVRSSATPRVNGPRSLMTTVTDLPFSGFVTVTFDPKGSERCAAVYAPESKA
jgi:hypothetical protein